MNQEKTQIINVYLDRKTAAVANGYSISGLDAHVKKGSMTNHYYYQLYETCNDELRDVFEEQYGEPILYKDGVGQYNTDHQLVREFVCKYDCIKQLKMSDKTLAKALDKSVCYQEHYFRTLGSKLSVVGSQ